MSEYIDNAVSELASLVQTTLSLPQGRLIVRSTKMTRFDWRDLVDTKERKGTSGIPTPFTVIRMEDLKPAVEWGMMNRAFYLPVEVFYVQSEKNRVATTVASTDSPDEFSPASSENIFVGQKLWFDRLKVWRRVYSLDPGPPFTVTLGLPAIGLQTGDKIYSDLVADTEIKAENLRDALLPGGSFSNFQIVREPMLDATDRNPVNRLMFDANYPFFCASVRVELLVGEIY